MIQAEDLTNNPKLIESILRIDGWLSREEGLILYHLAKIANQNHPIVEIGSFQGKSTIFIASALKEKRENVVYAIDPHKGSVKAGKKEYKPTLRLLAHNIKKFKVNKFVILIPKTSEEASIKWKKPISFLFIDGLHEYNYIKQDLTLWLPYLIDGGIVACHDAFTPYPGVFQAVEEEILGSSDYYDIGYVNSIIFARKGRPKNLISIFKSTFQKILIKTAGNIWQTDTLPESLRLFIIRIIKKILTVNSYHPYPFMRTIYKK